MEKIKLAICMKDLEYQDRFVNCFMNHYKQQYELHVFTNLDQLKQSISQEYAVIITGEYSMEEMTSFVERGEILLHLVEDDLGDNHNSTEKYQEVYKIVEKVGLLVACNEKRNFVYKGIAKYKKTGIYSLEKERYQIPFAALLAKFYSEEQKVLILDLQSYSGIWETENDVHTMGLEDLLSIAMTGKYSRGRMLESIRHESEFDYVSPAQNSQCLAEGSEELFTGIMDALVKEFGYERVIINFGTAFDGQIEMMEQCEEMYLLKGSEKGGDWRQKSFCKELKNWGKDEWLQSIKMISIPHVQKNESEWKSLVEKWSWGTLGDIVKNTIRRDYVNRTVM